MSTDWMRKHEKYGIIDEDSEVPGFGKCLWNVEANKSFKTSLDNGARTLVEALEKSKEQHGARRAVGWREVVKVHMIEEGGTKREKIELKNEYTWISYREYYDRVINAGRGLASLGVKPGSKVVIYAETQPDWMVSAFAAFHLSAQVVTIYATLGEEGAIHGINETEADTVMADAKLLKVLMKALPSCPLVKNLITLGPVDDEGKAKIRAVSASIAHVGSIDELVEGGKTWPADFRAPVPEEPAVIMYTSGTTGAPKGVIISHGNIVAAIAGAEHALRGAVNHEDTYIAYLPLAHIMEMAAEIAFFALGCALGYGSPHTLTDSGIKLKRPESMGDAPVLKPTFMLAAPAILDKIYQSVQQKRTEQGMLVKAMFRWGLESGDRHFKKSQIGAHSFWNSVLFAKVQTLVGGKLKGMITGSAPLSGDVQKFIQTVFNIPVRQGYGLTETCSGSCVGFWSDNSTQCVGPPTVSNVIRLADWPEGNYLNSDKDKPGIGMPRGEILIGGPCISLGYFINPASPNPELEKKNQEDWVEIQGVRYFRTGDIGQIRDNGNVQIIDRKKDLWKGPNGEYVALTKVEAAYNLCEFVELSMCYGRTGGEFPVSLVCPQKKRIEALAVEMDIKGDFPALCQEPRIVKKVHEACTAACKSQKLVEFEIPKKIALISQVWTPESDLLTAAMKLKRPLIAEAHRDIIDALYAPEASARAPK